MNPDWQTFLLSCGARLDADQREVNDFGLPDEELQASSTTILVPLAQLGLIACDGDDARSFLHNQLTSDINHLGENAAQHSAWCTAKGRMLASFVVWRQGDGYRLALAAELAEPIGKRFQMYVLRSKVTVANLCDRFVLLGLAGPDAERALAAAGLPAPATPMTTATVAATQVIRLDAQRFLIACPVEIAVSLWPALSAHARPAGIPVWRWLDVEAALPVISAATREEFVPQMADFEQIGGVSFHKGCYPGQEVVARTQYLGKIKRHLFRLQSQVPLAAGDDLLSPENPDQTIGKVVSAAPAPQGGFAGLAVIQSNFAENLRLKTLDGPSLSATAVNPHA